VDGQPRVDGDEVDNSTSISSSGSGSAVQAADEVLVVSLGMSTDCPGMLSEQKVYISTYCLHPLSTLASNMLTV